MAEAGIASRRDCETMIERGLVEVNGQTVTALPVLVNPATDRIVVDGLPLRRWSRGGRAAAASGGRFIYVMLNKPERVVTTVKDEQMLEGRKTVLDLVDHPAGPRLFPVGRLDYMTTGLLLLTNDGGIADVLTHPRYGAAKRYWALVRGAVTEADLPLIDKAVRAAEKHAVHARSRPAPRSGPAPRRRRAGRAVVRIVKREPGRTILEIAMTSGRIESVRDGLDAAGFGVRKLTRVGLGPLELKAVRVGEWRELERDEVRALKRFAREARGRAAPGSGMPGGARPVQAAPGSLGPPGRGADRGPAGQPSPRPPRPERRGPGA